MFLNLFRCETNALDIERMLSMILIHSIEIAIESIFHFLTPVDTAGIDEISKEMTFHIFDFDIEDVFVFVIFGSDNFECVFSFLVFVLDYIILPHIVMQVVRTWCILSYAIIIR